MIVLDTTVVSELMRPEPAPVVLAWLRRQVAADLFTTAVTLAEVRYGIARLPDGHRKDVLSQAADQVFGAFPDQILPFDSGAARVYADLARAVSAPAARSAALMRKSQPSAESTAQHWAAGASWTSVTPASR